ncbi:hypothetical protein K439DRAFT_1625591 [Ramaria rubella]|nr:hypothetical protein K439DRAFT_1625591 [Ramaria rubella]
MDHYHTIALSLAIDPVQPPQPQVLLSPTPMTILLACKGHYPCVPTMGNLDRFRGFVNTNITKALEHIDGILPNYFPHLPFAFQTQSFMHEIWVGTRRPRRSLASTGSILQSTFRASYLAEPAASRISELGHYHDHSAGCHACFAGIPKYTVLTWIAPETQYEALFAAGLPFGPLPTYKRDPLGRLNQAFDPNIVYSPPLVTLAPVPINEDLQLQRVVDFAWYIPEWYFALVWRIPSPQLEAERWHELAMTMDYLRMVLTARQATMPGSLRICFHRQFSVVIEILSGSWSDDLFIRLSRLSDLSCVTYERTQLVSGAGLVSLSRFLSMSVRPKLSPAALPPMLPEEDEEDA